MVRVDFLSFGIVVRRAALAERGLDMTLVLRAMNEKPLDADTQLLSFGPHFGREACDEYIRRLQELGLSYVDDFFELAWDHPDWLDFSARLKES